MVLEKMVLLTVLNLAGLIGLIRWLMLRGNSRGKALRIAWRMVVGGQTGGVASSDIYPLWSAALPISWWFMILCYIAVWVVTSDIAPGVAFILVLSFHGVWYWLSLKGQEDYHRIIRFNQQFGVIFQEIGLNSEMSGRSLAELDLRKKELLVLAVERAGRITPFPKGLEVLEAGDRLVIFGDLNAFGTIFGYL